MFQLAIASGAVADASRNFSVSAVFSTYYFLGYASGATGAVSYQVSSLASVPLLLARPRSLAARQVVLPAGTWIVDDVQGVTNSNLMPMVGMFIMGAGARTPRLASPPWLIGSARPGLWWLVFQAFAFRNLRTRQTACVGRRRRRHHCRHCPWHLNRPLPPAQPRM